MDEKYNCLVRQKNKHFEGELEMIESKRGIFFLV
jgi:hypothetical protein